MTAEQLNIKVKVDSSQAKKSINDVKTSLNSINKTTGVKNLTNSFTTFGRTATNSLRSVQTALSSLGMGSLTGSTIASITTAMEGLIALKESQAALKTESHAVSNAVGEMAGELAGAGITAEAVSRNIATAIPDNIRRLLGNVSDVIDGVFDNLDYDDMLDWGKEGEDLYNFGIQCSKLSREGVVAGESIEGMAEAGGILGTSLSALIPIIAGVVAAIGLMANSIKRASIGDEIKDESQKIYMATGAYQEWGYALQQNGIEISTLGTAMRTFAKNYSSGAFASYGIVGDDISTGFEDAIKYCQGLSSETEKAAAAVELFGSRSANQLMPILNMSNEETQALMNTYRQLGATMSEEMVSRSDVLSDSILEMKQAFGGLANELGMALMPMLTAIVQALTTVIGWVTKALSAIATFFGFSSNLSNSLKGSAKASKNIAVGSGVASDNLGSAAKSAKELKKYLAGFDELNIYSSNKTDSSSSGSSGGGIDTSDWDGYTTTTKKKKKRKWNDTGTTFEKGFSPISMRSAKDTEKAKKNWEAIKKTVKEANSYWKNSEGTGLYPKSMQDNDKNGLTAFKNKFIEIKQNIESKFIAFKTKLPSWSEIKQKFIDAYNSAKAWVESKTLTWKMTISTTISDIKDWINTHIIKPLNKNIHKVFPKISIPQLAKGGVLTSPTIVEVGEYAGARSNPEIVTPQSILTETLNSANDNLVGAFAQMTRQVITAIENNETIVSIGDETIARSAQRGNQSYKLRTGQSLI